MEKRPRSVANNQCTCTKCPELTEEQEYYIRLHAKECIDLMQKGEENANKPQDQD